MNTIQSGGSQRHSCFHFDQASRRFDREIMNGKLFTCLSLMHILNVGMEGKPTPTLKSQKGYSFYLLCFLF